MSSRWVSPIKTGLNSAAVSKLLSSTILVLFNQIIKTQISLHGQSLWVCVWKKSNWVSKWVTALSKLLVTFKVTHVTLSYHHFSLSDHFE